MSEKPKPPICEKHNEAMVPVRWLINQDGETENTEYACRSCIREANEKGEPIRIHLGSTLRMSEKEQQKDALDLLINTLREHEKELDRLIGEMQLLPTKREQIVSSLVYAINSELSLDKTTTRLFVSEFFHSLNRRGVIDNDETSLLVDEAYEQLKVK